MLLTLSEDTVLGLSKAIDRIVVQASKDGQIHDLTAPISSTGLIVHCTYDPIKVAGPRLERHCERRKYRQKSNTWYGICILPKDASVRFGISLEFEWVHSAEMDALTQDLAEPRVKNVSHWGSNPCYRRERATLSERS